MENQNFTNVTLKKRIQKEAWDEISHRYPLTTDLLFHFQNKLNWTEVSKNTSIHWDVFTMERFKDFLDWKAFSQNWSYSYLITAELIEKFKDYWDWHELSRNPALPLTYELVDKYIDRWDWSALINQNQNTPGFRFDYLKEKMVFLNEDFFERYKQYIPVDKLENSGLWVCLVEQEKEAIMKKMISVKK